ncbi:multiple sugar transport system substrate-binding protein [Motilibacter peucedani]|uniref:Multiple sugar transport system substrate-binding protein n=1 Tax=Motilibacter peucedani TaxID=598650 RepID=A0A420XU17_9ACTN|nr:extracellular solute-binding protein [Motilibacter peucedani]RKS80325.1 multiple sugar transport system substrate-binding protein [Motilibacter peucedani]
MTHEEPDGSVSLDGLPASTRRTFLALAGGVGLAGALAACGGDSGGVGGSASGGGGSTSSAGSGGGGGGGSKPTLSQWYHLYGEAGTQQAVMRYAKEYPDANVKVQWTPGDYTSKLASGLLSNNGPDVYESNVDVDSVKSGQCVALDDIVNKADYTDADIKATSVDGKIYGVKIVDDMGLLYYRKSLLSKAGVQPPTTMDELISVTKALSSNKMKGLFIGNDAGVTPAFGGGSLLGQICWAAGSDFLTPDGKPGFLTPEVKQSFLKLQQLANSGTILLGAPTDWWDPSSFTQGLAAMQWCGLWAYPGIQKALGDDVGVVPWPKLSASVGKPSTFLGGWTSMVSAKSKNVDAAKAYTKWLWVDNEKDQEDFNTSYGFHVPPKKALAAKATKLQSGVPAEALKIFNDYAVPGNPMWTPKMNSAYADAATAIVRKKGDVDSNLAKAKAVVESELARLSK